MDNTRISCADCGLDFPSEGMDGAPQRPCSQCGSTKRHIAVSLSETVGVHDQMRLKQRRPGVRRPVRELTVGDDLYRKTGEWNHLERDIDRENDRYRERIINPRTGEVIREVDEPLSEHRGRGAAMPESEGC